MANKRTLKKCINQICEELFAECVATSLYGIGSNKENAENIISSIVLLEDHYIRRVSHPEPGITAKAYFKDLQEKFNAQVGELIDQINA